MTRRIALALLLALGHGCSMLGRETDFADRVSTSGAGPYRLVEAPETALEGVPTDAIVMVGPEAVTSGIGADGFLFYAAAPPKAAPPPRDPSLAPHEIDLARFEPRTIRRAMSNGYAGFIQSEIILAAAAAWEGDAVYDPWPVVLPDGRLRLYYAAAGGIGLAEADSVGGALTRVGGGPVLGALPNDRIASSPTVVVDEALGTLMYFEVDGAIGLARSDDGVTFELVDGDPIGSGWDPLALDPPPPASADSPGELRIGHPGAVVAPMGSGRRTVRLYFEVFLDDGTRAISFAASLDGVAFERSASTLVAGDDPGTPAPQIDAQGETRLFLTQSSIRLEEQRRALYLAVGLSTVLPALE